METFQLRDPELARDYILESMLLSRAQQVTSETFELGLRLAMEIASEGSPLPPLGLVADIGILVTRTGIEGEGPVDVAGFDAGLARRYEDYVLGKFYADSSFERAIDAIAKYEGRDCDRAIAYLIRQICDRCDVGGPVLSPGVIKSLSKEESEEVHSLALTLIESEGISSEMREDYQDLITAIKSGGDTLGAEDVFELEHGTALAEFGQRIALRQVLRSSVDFEKELPNQKPRARIRSYSVASNIMEEDYYPIGGFSSISNRGTIESLVRSELAYIDKEVRPDLFDIKFARGELLYYSRDENQFLRRRLSFVFQLHPDLTAARFKDAQLQYQRIVLVMAMMYAAVRRLSQWLSDDALCFYLVFVESEGAAELDDERELFATLFREQIANGSVEIVELKASKVREFCGDLARTSLCQVLSVSPNLHPFDDSLAAASHMILDDSRPTLMLDEDTSFQSEELDFDGWRESLETLLKFWI